MILKLPSWAMKEVDVHTDTISTRYIEIQGQDLDVRFDIEMIDDELYIRSVHGQINIEPVVSNKIKVKVSFD